MKNDKKLLENIKNLEKKCQNYMKNISTCHLQSLVPKSVILDLVSPNESKMESIKPSL